LEFEDIEEATNALRKSKGIRIDHQLVRVSYAKKKLDKMEGDGKMMGEENIIYQDDYFQSSDFSDHINSENYFPSYLHSSPDPKFPVPRGYVFDSSSGWYFCKDSGYYFDAQTGIFFNFLFFIF
jgi:hypothetical protein